MKDKYDEWGIISAITNYKATKLIDDESVLWSTEYILNTAEKSQAHCMYACVKTASSVNVLLALQFVFEDRRSDIMQREIPQKDADVSRFFLYSVDNYPVWTILAILKIASYFTKKSFLASEYAAVSIISVWISGTKHRINHHS